MDLSGIQRLRELADVVPAKVLVFPLTRYNLLPGERARLFAKFKPCF